MVTKDYSKSRMRENRTYGSVRGGQSNLIPSTRLTAAMPLRVVEGASKFIEGASLYKTFTTALRALEIHSPFGALRHHLPAPLGRVSHDSQVALLPYESCSLATAERWDYGYLAMEPCLCRKA